MKLTPNTQTEALKDICDELLSATGKLRELRKSTAEPWPNPEAKRLIDRLLDIRNQVSPPSTKPQTNTTSCKPTTTPR